MNCNCARFLIEYSSSAPPVLLCLLLLNFPLLLLVALSPHLFILTRPDDFRSRFLIRFMARTSFFIRASTFRKRPILRLRKSNQ